MKREDIYRTARILEGVMTGFDPFFPDTSALQYALPRNSPLPREKDFPYDDDDEDRGVGKTLTGRGDDKGEPSHHGIVPKDTAHTQWDDGDGVDEAMGSPSNMAQAYSGGQGMGSNIPGANGSWNKNPPKDWDKDDEDELLSYYGDVSEGGPLSMNPGLHDIPEPELTPGPEDVHDQTDDDLEDAIADVHDNSGFRNDGSTGNFPSAIGIIVSPGQPGAFKAGLGASGRSSRGGYGMIPKESVWRDLALLLRRK